ncbi:MAG: hypothetical protein NXI31_17785 [bacterium]|nr:hypothetical protein [bacterium]
MNRLAIGALACVATAAMTLAQQTKVLPAGMAAVEGPLVYTYPFGRTTGAMQLLYDADQVTLGQGLVMGIRFRQSQITASQTNPGYTKNYKVTAWTVLTNATSMVADPASNIGSAAATVVFQGPLTLPPTAPLTVQPATFDIHIPFTTPYVFDGAQGNLLLVVETDDTTTPPSGYRIDAVNFRFSQVTGLTQDIDSQGCVVNGESLSLAASETNVVVGGALSHTITSTSVGAFPLAIATVGFEAQPTDLTPFGLPGCTWHLPTTALSRFVFENGGGGYNQVDWTLPNNPVIEGIPLVSQIFGLAASGLLADSVTSNSTGSRIGGAAGPTRNMGMSFSNGSGWFMGTNGVFVTVAELDGIFP